MKETIKKFNDVLDVRHPRMWKNHY
jgi:hypothetical protein